VSCKVEDGVPSQTLPGSCRARQQQNITAQALDLPTLRNAAARHPEWSGFFKIAAKKFTHQGNVKVGGDEAPLFY